MTKKIGGLLAVLVLLTLIFGVYKFLDTKNILPWQIKFPKASHQAVFLSNGQVYFGRVSNLNQDYVKLTDIYYLILKRPLQEQTPSGPAPSPTPEYTLIKLGNELHGPKDEMIINRQHVLFIEDLKNDSRVSQAIADFKAGKVPTPTQSP